MDVMCSASNSNTRDYAWQEQDKPIQVESASLACGMGACPSNAAHSFVRS